MALGAQSQARAEVPFAISRLAAIADYVASDYAGSVKDGRVIAITEYQESRGLLEEARSLTVQATPLPGHEAAREALSREVEDLILAFRNQSPESEIRIRSRRVVDRLFDDYGLAVGPIETPSRERAQELYGPSCGICHGEDGRANTERAHALSPPPLSFFDAERMSRISPRVAFDALTFGVSNTAMASFEVVPEADRWNLAFLAVAFRHDAAPAALARGRSLFESARASIPPTPSSLSELSDLDLDALLASTLPAPADREAAIAWLRNDATFSPGPPGPYATARGELADLARETDPGRARALAASIALDVVEPLQPLLLFRNRGLAGELERESIDLRRAAGSSDSSEIRPRVSRLLQRLDRVEAANGWDHPPALVGSLLSFRDALAAALGLAILIAVCRRRAWPGRALLLASATGLAVGVGVALLRNAAGMNRLLLSAGSGFATAAALLATGVVVLPARAGRGNQLAAIALAVALAYGAATTTFRDLQALATRASASAGIWLGALAAAILMAGLVASVARMARPASTPRGSWASAAILVALAAVTAAQALGLLRLTLG